MGMKRDMPTITCLCGSTKFKEAFLEANKNLTLEGQIVVTVGYFGHVQGELTPELKHKVDILHFHKIDLADRVLILNQGGYIGESTQRELGFALLRGKYVSFLDELAGERYMSDYAHQIAKAGLDALRMMGEHV